MLIMPSIILAVMFIIVMLIYYLIYWQRSLRTANSKGICFLNISVFENFSFQRCTYFYNNLTGFASVARRGPPSVMSGFSISVQRPSRLHPSGSCVSSSEKLMNFMHFHNSCTRNCGLSCFLNHDWQCPQRILPQIIVNTCEDAGIVHNHNWL